MGEKARFQKVPTAPNDDFIARRAFFLEYTMFALKNVGVNLLLLFFSIYLCNQEIYKPPSLPCI